MADLTQPKVVIGHLLEARLALDAAHHAAGESEGEEDDLSGWVRDMLFGLNTAVDALVSMIEQASDKEDPHG